MRPVSLHRSAIFRAALIYLCLFSATVLVVVAVIYWRTTESVSRQIDATIDAEITGLAEQYRQGGTTGLVRAIEGRAAAAGDTRALYLLTDRNYRPLAGNLSGWPDAEPDPGGWITFRLTHADPEGAGINFGRARVFDLPGAVHLLVGHDTRERDRVTDAIRDSLIWGIAVTIGLSLVGAMLFARSLLRRIESINVTSREIVGGDLSQRVPVSGRGDEFDRLAGSLNVMLDQIEHLLNGLKDVTDNIAHDLRSPLGRLRNRLETLLASAPDDATMRVSLETAIKDADSLLTTFTALLSIAQAEAGAPRRHFEPVDLADVVRDAAELYEPLADEAGLTLETEIVGSTTIAGDRNLLFQALTNLLDNAIKYAPSGDRLTLTFAPADLDASIVVADEGPGIPAAARDKVLERFYRLEVSRSTPGSGLGLSLAAAVARLHGGNIGLDDNNPGLRVELTLPKSPPAAP